MKFVVNRALTNENIAGQKSQSRKMGHDREHQGLKSPVLVIAGSEDTGATQAAINFLSGAKAAKQVCEMFVYPGADHGYAQPLFNEGKNYNPEAVRTTWILVEDFLASHLRP